MSSHKFISDEDLAQVMKPRIEELMAMTVPRVVAENAGQDVRVKLSASKKGAKGNQASSLGTEEREFLESILEKPNLTVTQRRDYLGLSTYKNDQLKKMLLERALIEELSLNLGHETRGLVKFLELTEQGYKALGKQAPYKRLTNCSPEHWFWQRNIAAYYRSQGYETKIEMNLNGKRADVGFIKDGNKIAVEVGLTPKNEVVNVQKDLEAGFDNVLVACKNARVKQAVKERLNAVLSEKQLSKVRVILLSDFSFVKEILGK